MLSAIGFALPWTPSIAGRISGAATADLIVAFAPHLNDLPPVWFGWAGLAAFVLVGVALAVVALRDGIAALVAFPVALIFLFLAFGLRSANSKGSFLVGWWVCVAGALLTLFGSIAVWRWPFERTNWTKWPLAGLGVVMCGLAVVVIVSGQSRRTLGAASPEAGAREMVLAAYRADPYDAVKVLDPDEIASAEKLFGGLGRKLAWLSQLKGVLGGQTPTGVDTTAAARADGSVGVKVIGLRRTGGDATAGRLGIRQRPTIIMVERNGRWFVSGKASISEATKSLIGGLL
jgi:hypothetical protein